MRRNSVAKIVGSIILAFVIIRAEAQYEASPYGGNTQRSIWDKEPEPKTDPASPFGSTPQRVGSIVQQNGTSANPPGFDGNTTDGVPIDGGLSLLMAAGALYGARKTYQSRKSKNAEKKHH